MSPSGEGRVLPAVDELTRDFWTGGAYGELRINRCNACSRYHHPPAPVCPDCHGLDVAPVAVSGQGTVHSHTINRYPTTPEPTPPYVVVQVELAEQPDLIITGNWTGGDEHPPSIGMPTETTFLQVSDVHLPMFGPREAGNGD